MSRGNGDKESYMYRTKTWTEQAPKKRENEDLLTYYLRLQYAKKRCLHSNQETNSFPLPISDSMIRDIEVLQEFIKKYEPRGARFSKEEVVIKSDDNEVSKPRSSVYPYCDGDSDEVAEHPRNGNY